MSEMDCVKDILNRLLDRYEKREAFDEPVAAIRAVQIDLKKEYPEYFNRYNHETYRNINVAVDTLLREGCIIAKKMKPVNMPN